MSKLTVVQTFAELLASWATAEGLTKQTAIATRLGVSQQQISKWLSGQSLPDQDSLDDLAERIGAAPDDVWSAYATSVAARGRVRRTLTDDEVRRRLDDLAGQVADLRAEVRELAALLAGTGVATSPRPSPGAAPPRTQRRTAAT